MGGGGELTGRWWGVEQVDVLVVGPEADRLVDVLAAPLAKTSPSVGLRGAPGALASSGMGRRVSRALVLPDVETAMLRLHFHTVKGGPPRTPMGELLDPHLIGALRATAPFCCVVVTYTCGSEESLKQAEHLVHQLASRKLRPKQRKAKDHHHHHSHGLETDCTCGAYQHESDGVESALAEALTEPARVWKVGLGLLVGVEPAAPLAPLPPLLPFSPADVSAHTTAATGALPAKSPVTRPYAKEAEARLMKRAVEIMEPFRSAPRRVSDQDPWSALGIYEWAVDIHNQLHPDMPPIPVASVSSLLGRPLP